MSLLENIKSILLPGSEKKELVCPRCERSLLDHDDARCQRLMSRRSFFMGVGGVIATAAVAKVLPKRGDGSLFNPVQDLAAQWKASVLGKFDVADAPVEQLVREASPKIVTAGMRGDVFIHRSRGSWASGQGHLYGLKGPSGDGEYVGAYEKSKRLKDHEDVAFDGNFAHLTRPRFEAAGQTIDYHRRQEAEKATRDAQYKMAELRLQSFPGYRKHPTVLRFAWPKEQRIDLHANVCGPKGKLPA